MVHVRKITNGLDTEAVKQLTSAWTFANVIGRSLNVMLSYRPINGDEMTAEEHLAAYARFRNKLGCYARLRRFQPVYAWTLEADESGTGIHMHVLMHVPPRWRDDFEATAIGWEQGPDEIDVRTASRKVTFTTGDRKRSAIGYLCKQSTPQAAWARGLTRYRGTFPIKGKRWGTTANLTAKAQAAYHERRSPRPPEAIIQPTVRPALCGLFHAREASPITSQRATGPGARRRISSGTALSKKRIETHGSATETQARQAHP
jgi:hypothetical protein